MPLIALNRVAAMSQSVSSQTRSATQAESADAASLNLRFDLNQPVTAAIMEGNAADLINLLFADVDRMLERGVVLPIEPPPESSAEPPDTGLEVTMESLLSSQFASQFASFAPKLAPRDLMPPLELEAPESALAGTLEPPAFPEAVSQTIPDQQRAGSLGLVALCGSLLLSLGILSFLYRTQVSGLWLTLLEKYRPNPVTVVSPADSTAAQPAAQPTAPPAEHADFLDYLQRSLERLSRHTELPPSPVISPTLSGATASPSPAVVERVYVPIYPTAISPAPAPAAPAIAQTPQRSSQGTSKPAKPSPSVRLSPQPSAIATPNVAAVPNIEAGTQHTLIGVLELGERSAALFEVNGTPKRIEVGEQIGSSGWTLVSIRNQEAIVRRNGEVRSIYVGQKF